MIYLILILLFGCNDFNASKSNCCGKYKEGYKMIAEKQLIFQGKGSNYSENDIHHINTNSDISHEYKQLESDNAKIQYFYLKNNTNEDKKNKLIIFFPGAKHNIGKGSWLYYNLCNLGYDVLTLDYRGYGNSTGEPTKESCMKDAEALLGFARSKGYEDKDIIVVGQSLGTAFATHLASQNKDLHAVILIAPFSKIINALQKQTRKVNPLQNLIEWYLSDDEKFDNLSKVSSIKCPIHIIYDKKDKLFPPNGHAQVLINNNKKAKVTEYEDEGHNISSTKIIAFFENLDVNS